MVKEKENWTEGKKSEETKKWCQKPPKQISGQHVSEKEEEKIAG